jgi:hypothetical protein
MAAAVLAGSSGMALSCRAASLSRGSSRPAWRMRDSGLDLGDEALGNTEPPPLVG